MSCAAGDAVRIRRIEGPPLVAIRLAVPGGARIESTPGLALLAGRLLLEGAARRDWRRIARDADDLGAGLNATAGWDATYLGVDVLASDWERALDWAAELVLEPTFPEDRLRHVAAQTVGELAALADQGEVVAEWAFQRQLWGEAPRGRPLQGDVESLGSVGPADCAAFHAAGLGRGIGLAVAGPVDEEQVARRVQWLFGDGRIVDAAPAAAPPAVGAGDGRVDQVVRLPCGDQAHVYLGRLTARRDDPLMPCLDLLAVVLGAGTGVSGRLPERVRESEGLAYVVDVATASGAGLDAGRLEVYLGTSPERVPRAVAVVREELDRVAEHGIGEDELVASRAYLLGRLPFSRETAAQWAGRMLETWAYGLPFDRPGWLEERFAEVGRGDVERAAARLLEAGSLRLTVGLPGPESS